MFSLFDKAQEAAQIPALMIISRLKDEQQTPPKNWHETKTPGVKTHHKKTLQPHLNAP